MTQANPMPFTSPNPELDAMRAKTPSGMAHWAGTGPSGKSCGGCANYGYPYVDSKDKSRRKRTSCAIYYNRMGKHGEALPRATPACKYFI